MRYIGSKFRVLEFIKDTILSTYGPFSHVTVADLFSGTACVAEMFKSEKARIITNDYLHFSFALQYAKIKLNTVPKCKIPYTTALNQLNTISGIDGFFTREYTLEGLSVTGHSRNYFSLGNARKIDAICTQLRNWLDNGDINTDMFYLITASLVDAITKVSNTSGTYGAFLKIDDNRKNGAIFLEPLEIIDNGQENECYCLDIFDVIEKVSGDILYLDPPYNNRQYPPYYHILETAVLYDDPAIYGITGRRPYEDKLSPFCMKEKALPAMLQIIARAKFSHIYISYSTEGIIPYKDFCKSLELYGDVTCFFKPYRRYKSNDGGVSSKTLKEIIIYVKK